MRNSDRSFFINDIYIQEWNANQDQAILYIHGFPGCADQARLMTTTPLLENFRLIAIDRPGYGKSKYQPKLTPVKFAQQLVEILDQLNVKKVSILSVSGGAPYSMALAHLLKDRAIKLCSIGGVAPLTRTNRRFMNTQQKKAWWFNRVVPSKVAHFILNRYWQKGLERVEKMLFTNLDSFSKPDRIVFSHPDISPILAATLKTSIENGPQGVLHDMKVYSRDWGFPLGQITCPVTLWHGSKDDVVHSVFAQEMKGRLAKVELKMMPEEGHFSIAMNYRDEIIQDLLM